MVRLTVRRIGNSLGCIVPKAEVDRLDLQAGQEVDVVIHRSSTVMELWGLFRDSELTVDQLNDLADEGEDLW